MEAAGARAIDQLQHLGPAWHVVAWPHVKPLAEQFTPFDQPGAADRTGFLAIGPGGVFAVTVVDHGRSRVMIAGDVVQIAWPDVVTILLGARTSRSEVERSDKSKSFSVGMAVATGGLKLTRTSTRIQRSSEESSEQVILAYARDGGSVTLAEHALDFSCLGPGMQPSSTANMAELARRLRERAKGAYFDNRLLQLGRRPLPFLAGGESSSRSGSTTVTHTSTSESLDVLAEVMRQALAQGLLP
jgi:hypothetical protein